MSLPADLPVAHTACLDALKAATARADRTEARIIIALAYIEQHKTSASHPCPHLAEIERRLKP